MSNASPPVIDRRRLLTAAAVAGASIGAGPAAAQSSCDGAPFVVAPIPPQAPAQERRIRVGDGVNLWCWDTGGPGEPVVLLHPRTGSGLIWSYQQPVLAKAGYRVIGYSQRGHARSDVGPKDRPGTGSQDLHALLAALNIDRFHAVSTAAGGFVAADYALSHGERLLSLTLACSILGVQDDVLDAMDKRLRPAFFAQLPADFQELGPSYRASNPDGHALWLALNAISAEPGLVRQPLANAINLTSLKAIKAPTLLICGDSDLIAPPPVIRAFAKAMPPARLEVISECGHSAYWERPELFNRLVIDFIGRRRGLAHSSS